MFSGAKAARSESSEVSASLVRIVGLLLEGCAAHAVEFDSAALDVFRQTLREVAGRFEQAASTEDFLILAGEADNTLRSYGQSIEKYISLIMAEKQRAFSLLTESLLRVGHCSAQSTQNLRHIEGELKSASQLDEVRMLGAKLADVVNTLCQEAEQHEEQLKEVQSRVSVSAVPGSLDEVTSLPTLNQAEVRISEVASGGQQGFVVAFFLKNVEVVNRRFGFAAGDGVLRQFAAYVGKNLVGSDQLFRWRGPCFVVIAERAGSIEKFKTEADKVGARGPEQEVEGQGKSMLFRLTAATAVFRIAKAQDNSDLSGKIDRFASEQFKQFARAE